MATTLQGSKELRAKIVTINDQLKSLADASTSGLNEGRRVVSKLEQRIDDREAPKEDRIAPLAESLATLQAGLVALAGQITVPTAEEFQGLAETPNP